MVILIKGEGRGYGTRVGASWQPDVADDDWEDDE